MNFITPYFNIKFINNPYLLEIRSAAKHFQKSVSHWGRVFFRNRAQMFSVAYIIWRRAALKRKLIKPTLSRCTIRNWKKIASELAHRSLLHMYKCLIVLWVCIYINLTYTRYTMVYGVLVDSCRRLVFNSPLHFWRIYTCWYRSLICTRPVERGDCTDFCFSTYCIFFLQINRPKWRSRGGIVGV